MLKAIFLVAFLYSLFGFHCLLYFRIYMYIGCVYSPLRCSCVKILLGLNAVSMVRHMSD